MEGRRGDINIESDMIIVNNNFKFVEMSALTSDGKKNVGTQIDIKRKTGDQTPLSTWYRSETNNDSSQFDNFDATYEGTYKDGKTYKFEIKANTNKTHFYIKESNTNNSGTDSRDGDNTPFEGLLDFIKQRHEASEIVLWTRPSAADANFTSSNANGATSPYVTQSDDTAALSSGDAQFIKLPINAWDPCNDGFSLILIPKIK